MSGKTQNLPCVVSVVMTAKNEGLAITKAITSMLSQSLADFELIVVDDGSTDNTRSEIEKIVDPRVRLIVNEVNIGISRSRNLAIKQARGRYIAIFDADDVSVPERLEKQARFLDEHPGAALCGSWGIRKAPGHTELFRQPVTPEEIVSCLGKTNPVINSSMMVRADILKKYLYDETLGRHEDYDFILRCAKVERLANIPEVLIEFEASDDISYAIREHYWKTVVRLRAVFTYGYPVKMLFWILPSIVVPFIPYRLKILLKKLCV